MIFDDDMVLLADDPSKISYLPLWPGRTIPQTAWDDNKSKKMNRTNMFPRKTVVQHLDPSIV